MLPTGKELNLLQFYYGAIYSWVKVHLGGLDQGIGVGGEGPGGGDIIEGIIWVGATIS